MKVKNQFVRLHCDNKEEALVFYEAVIQLGTELQNIGQTLKPEAILYGLVSGAFEQIRIAKEPAKAPEKPIIQLLN